MKTSVILRRSAQSIEIETIVNYGSTMVSIRRYYTGDDGLKRPGGTAIYVPLSALPKLVEALSSMKDALLGTGGAQ